MTKQSNDIVEQPYTRADEQADQANAAYYDEVATRALVPAEVHQLPTLYPGADRATLTHEQLKAVRAYEARYREATENLNDLKNQVAAGKLPLARLAVTGVFIEDDVEMEARDNDNKPVIDQETGEVQMTVKDMTYVRTSAARFGKERPIIENEVYYKSASPIVKRYFLGVMKDYNSGHMGDFEVFVPVEVYNKIYSNGHAGIGLRDVEEL